MSYSNTSWDIVSCGRLDQTGLATRDYMTHDLWTSAPMIPASSPAHRTYLGLRSMCTSSRGVEDSDQQQQPLHLYPLPTHSWYRQG